MLPGLEYGIDLILKRFKKFFFLFYSWHVVAEVQHAHFVVQRAHHVEIRPQPVLCMQCCCL